MPVARFQADKPTRALERLVLSERCLARGIYGPDALRALVRKAAAFEWPQVFTLASLELWLRVNVDQVRLKPGARLEELLDERKPRIAAGSVP